jgi:hypothetical protein
VSFEEVVEALRECVAAIKSGSLNDKHAKALEVVQPLLAKLDSEGK